VLAQQKLLSQQLFHARVRLQSWQQGWTAGTHDGHRHFHLTLNLDPF